MYRFHFMVKNMYLKQEMGNVIKIKHSPRTGKSYYLLQFLLLYLYGIKEIQ